MDRSKCIWWRLRTFRRWVLCCPALLIPLVSSGYTCDCQTSGNWSNASTWQNCGGGIPGAADNVTIKSGRTVTVDISNAACMNLTLSAGGFSNSGRLNFNSGSQLTMGGTFTFTQSLFSWPTLDMTNGGTLICNDWNAGFIGTFTCGVGKVRFTGNSFSLPWNFFMDQFYDLEVAMGSNLNLVLGLSILNDLTISSGTLAAASFDIAIGGDWDNTGGAYTASNNTVTFNGGSVQTIRTNGSPFEDLTIANTGGDVTLMADATVNNTLDFSSGHMVVDAYNLTVNAINGAGSARHIVTNGTGTVQKPNLTGAFTFPVGSSAAFYNPITIDNSAGAAGRFDVRACSNVYDDGTCGGAQLTSMLVNNTWQVSTTSPSPDIDVTVQWDAVQESADFDRALTYISVYGGGTWNQQGGPSPSGGSGPYTQGYSGIAALGPIAVGGGIGGPLPVELLSFDATPTKEGVFLEWVTASETNNDYFTIEASGVSAGQDQPQFYPIGTVKGQGNSQMITRYTFLDTKSDAVRNHRQAFYRLKQTDFNGTGICHDTVAVDLAGIDAGTGRKEQARIFPNPSNGDNLTMVLKGFGADETIPVTITDLSGKSVFSTYVHTGHDGSLTAFMTDGAKLGPGIYMVSLHIPSGPVGLRLMIVN